MPPISSMFRRVRRIRQKMTSVLPESQGLGANGKCVALDRDALKERLWIEGRMLNSSLRLIHFFFLLSGYLYCLTSHQPIQMVAEVHRRLAKHYGLDDVEALESLTSPSSVMDFLQLFAERTYDLAATIVDAHTLDKVDITRCFRGFRHLDKICKAKYWDLPIRHWGHPNYVHLEDLMLDQISRSVLNSSKICRDPPPDRTHDNCIDGREKPLGQLNPNLNRSVFGLTPEYPIIFDPAGQFQDSSHSILMPLVWQVRSPVVPCAHFHRLYNNDLLGAGRCQPDQPCNSKSLPSLVARQKHWASNRTQSIYLTYGNEIMDCVDRSQFTSTFHDRSFSEYATFSDMTEGAPVQSVTLEDGRPAFFKFFPDIAFLQAPVAQNIYLSKNCSQECSVEGYEWASPGCAAPFLNEWHPLWTEVSSHAYMDPCSWRSKLMRTYYETDPKDRRNTFFTRETTELTVASFIVTPQPESYREIITLVRVVFSVSQGGEITARSFLQSTTKCFWEWYLLAGVIVVVAFIYLVADVRHFLKMRQVYVNRLFVQRLAIYMDLFLPLLILAVLIWMVILDETTGGRSMEAYLSDSFATHSEESYFKTVQQIVEHHNSVRILHKFGFTVGILQIIRLVLYFGMHPRLAVLMDTVRYACDEIWHFGIIFTMLYLFMGLLAHWMFGQTRDHFSSPSQAFWTQLGMFIGEYGYALPEDTPADAEFIIYQLVYIFVMFLVLLNFFLAIVVDAYAAVRRAIEDCQVEDELLHDFLDVIYTACMQRWLRWPSGNDVYKTLFHLSEKGSEHGNTVTVDNLYEHVLNRKGERIFRSFDHAAEYVDYYAEKLSKYGDFVQRNAVPEVPDGSPPDMPVSSCRIDAGSMKNGGAATESDQADNPSVMPELTSLRTAMLPNGDESADDDSRSLETARDTRQPPSHGRTRRLVEMLDQLTAMTCANGKELSQAEARIEELEAENDKLREELELYRPKATLLHQAINESGAGEGFASLDGLAC